MKKIILWAVSIFILTLNAASFAASWEANPTPEDSAFAISNVEIKDDKNIDFTFSTALAEEPVELKIVRISDKTELWIEDTVINKERTKASVKLVDWLVKNELYGYYVASALSEDGKKLNQIPDDIIDMEIPAWLELPEANVEAKTEEISKSMQDAFEETKANPELVWETRTESLDAAPVVENSAISAINPISQSGQQSQDISIGNSKQLPKTWPAESLLIVVSLIAWAYIIYARRNKIKA